MRLGERRHAVESPLAWERRPPRRVEVNDREHVDGPGVLGREERAGRADPIDGEVVEHGLRDRLGVRGADQMAVDLPRLRRAVESLGRVSDFCANRRVPSRPSKA